MAHQDTGHHDIVFRTFLSRPSPLPLLNEGLQLGYQVLGSGNEKIPLNEILEVNTVTPFSAAKPDLGRI